MRVRRPVVCLTVAMLSIAVPVLADSFTVLGLTRTISVTATAGQSSSNGGGFNRELLDQTRMASAGDDFAHANASLDSTGTSGNEFAAMGNTLLIRSSAAAEVGGTATSTFGVDFLVNDPLQFIFGATFAAFGPGSSWLAVLQSESGDVFRFEGSSSLGPLANGLLAPGRYQFLAQARTSVDPQAGSSYSGAAFNVAFGLNDVASPTPEPGSLLLLGTGAAGLVARRRRHRA